MANSSPRVVSVVRVYHSSSSLSFESIGLSFQSIIPVYHSSLSFQSSCYKDDWSPYMLFTWPLAHLTTPHALYAENDQECTMLLFGPYSCGGQTNCMCVHAHAQVGASTRRVLTWNHANENIRYSYFMIVHMKYEYLIFSYVFHWFLLDQIFQIVQLYRACTNPLDDASRVLLSNLETLTTLEHMLITIFRTNICNLLKTHLSCNERSFYACTTLFHTCLCHVHLVRKVIKCSQGMCPSASNITLMKMLLNKWRQQWSKLSGDQIINSETTTTALSQTHFNYANSYTSFFSETLGA